MRIFAKNRRAFFDYQIIEKYEAGIELFGFEVKSIKNGKISLRGSFVIESRGEIYLLNASISPYQPKNTPKEYEPTRRRKLLLKKKEINTLIGKSKQQGLTLIPLRVYNKGYKIKIEIALAKSKKKFQKKEKKKERDIKREMERETKENL
ncbi:MAG: SsrA-binding protein SmpB [Candidatus Pacebacteria bacterium]|nr:SsrA-binding protein SmpB [Candidatus Paceibacterota bacterium]